MAGWWARRKSRREGTAVDGARNSPADGGGRRSETTVIDLTEPVAWAARATADPQKAAEVAERLRARRDRIEAQRDLVRLREWHWSGERIIQEGRVDKEWWEHTDADPYAVLGLVPGAPLEEAAAARRRVAAECHPDRVDASLVDPEVAFRRMVAANVAYERIRRALRPLL